MPDIAMCAGERKTQSKVNDDAIRLGPEDVICPLRETCWRYTAPPNGRRQTYIFPPFEGNECDSYWPTKDD